MKDNAPFKRHGVIVTGAHTGLGAALTHGLIGRPDIATIAFSRNIIPGLIAAGIQCIACDLAILPADARLREKIAGELVAQIKQTHADRWTFINNAAILGPLGATAQLHFEDFAETVNVNLLAPAYLVSILLGMHPHMGRRLRVLNVSTGAAIRARQGWAAYCASKAGARMFFDAAALDGAEVIHFDPGVMDTGMQAKLRAADELADCAEFSEMYARGQLQPPASVAARMMDLYF